MDVDKLQDLMGRMTPPHVWIDWSEANKAHLAYDDAPENGNQDCRDHYVSFAAYNAVVVSLAETEALELQHGAVIARLTAERDQAVAASQKLADENRRLMVRDAEARRLLGHVDFSSKSKWTSAVRAFLAGEGK